MPSLSPQLAVEKFRVAFSIGVPSAWNGLTILGGSAFGGGHRPFGPLGGPRPLGQYNVGLSTALSRQYRNGAAQSQSQLAVLRSRLAHAVTISAHLIYPVYCLKFDKSGRYFLTGADDQVVKLF